MENQNNIFRNGIIKILDNYLANDFNIDIIKENIPYEYNFPLACTNGEDVIEYLLKEYSLLLRSFGLKYCGKVNDSYYWFPFLIYYDWYKSIKIFFINLEPNAENKFAFIKSVKANSYSPVYESEVTNIYNYYDYFIIPNKIFQIENNNSIIEVFNQLKILENNNDYIKISCNKDIYDIDKINNIITFLYPL